MKNINFNELQMSNYRPYDENLLCPKCRAEVEEMNTK